jgi:hypothetical protein
VFDVDAFYAKLIIRKDAVHFRVDFDKFNVHIRNSVCTCTLHIDFAYSSLAHREGC